MELALRALCLFVGYLCGSILTAEIVVRIKTGKSAHELGTGNPGMANVMANLGKKEGIAVLFGDGAKTLLACALCALLAGHSIGHAAVLWAGLGAILGHNYSVLAKGHGGKGVAVTCVWLMVYLPVYGALCCAAGGVLVLLFGYLPLGAVVIPVLAVPVAFVHYGPESGAVTLAAAALMLSRHYRGLIRMCRGSEPRFFRKKP